MRLWVKKMDKLFNTVSVVIGIVGGFVSYAFGAFDLMLKILIAIMAIDYVTGIIKAAYNKELSSYTGWRGLLKKVATLCVVALAHLLQMLLGDNVGIRDIVIMFYIANEGLSVLENVSAVVPVIPEPLRDVLVQLREDKSDEDC